MAATEDEAARKDAPCHALEDKATIDSATRHKDDRKASFVHRPVSVDDQWKQRLLHQRIRNWQLCPESVDKVD